MEYYSRDEGIPVYTEVMSFSYSRMAEITDQLQNPKSVTNQYF